MEKWKVPLAHTNDQMQEHRGEGVRFTSSDAIGLILLHEHL